MVDSALEKPDVALSNHGTIGLNRVPLRALRSFFLTQNRGAGPVSFNYLPFPSLFGCKKVKENESKNVMFLNPKIKFVGL